VADEPNTKWNVTGKFLRSQVDSQQTAVEKSVEGEKRDRQTDASTESMPVKGRGDLSEEPRTGFSRLVAGLLSRKRNK